MWHFYYQPTHTAAELSKSLNDYISGKSNLSLCVSICTDGVAAMTGWFSGFNTQVKRSLLNVSLCAVSSIKKCWLAKKCHLNLTTFCRTRSKLSTSLNCMPLSLFAQLCEEMDAEHTRLLLYTEVRRLSKGRSLARVFEL